MKFKNTAIHPVSVKVENSRKMKGIGRPRSVASARFSQTMALKRFTLNNTLDKEIHDLLTSSVAMTDSKIFQAEADRS